MFFVLYPEILFVVTCVITYIRAILNKGCGYIRVYMVKDGWTKTKNYRLPQRTLEQLEYLSTEAGLRNATEAIIIAVDISEPALKEELNGRKSDISDWETVRA